MIKNLSQKESTTVKGQMWYSWDEYCDACNAQFRVSKGMDSSEPPKEELGFCIRCLTHAIDKGIPKDKLVEAMQKKRLKIDNRKTKRTRK